MHGDRIGRRIADTIVAILSLGAPRRFLLKPAAGGRSHRFDLGGGDLLVMGGACQRTWRHGIPKVQVGGAEDQHPVSRAASRMIEPWGGSMRRGVVFDGRTAIARFTSASARLGRP